MCLIHVSDQHYSENVVRVGTVMLWYFVLVLTRQKSLSDVPTTLSGAFEIVPRFKST